MSRGGDEAAASALADHLGAHGISVRALVSTEPGWHERVDRWWTMTAWLAQHAVAFDALFGKLNFAARKSREHWPAEARQTLVVGEYGRELLERAQACGLLRWSTEGEVEFASQ